MKKLKRIAIAVALTGCAVGVASAQESSYNPFRLDSGPVYDYNSSIYVMPQIGGFNPDNRFGSTKKDGALGLKFGKAVNRYFDVQVGGSYARVHDNNFRYQQSLFGIDGLYMFSRDRVRPFLLLGIGAENDRRNIPNRQNSRTSPYAAAGVGVQYIISDQWAAQLDFKRVFGFQRSGVYGSNRRNENNYLMLGASYYFDKTPSRPIARQTPPPPAPVAQASPEAPPPPPPRFEKQTMSATELFAFNSAVLRQPQPKLDSIADLLTKNSQISNVTVTGYTDRIGSDKYNLKLSQRRAEAVKTYLVGKGVEGSRLNTVGKGKADPVVQCGDKKRPELIKCLEPNRRVEVEQIMVEKRVQ